MNLLHLATTAAKNAEAAYRFYSVKKDMAAAEEWWQRLCYWQERIAQMKR